MNTRRIFTAAAVAAMVALGGCRNPFNPSARIRFDQFYCGPNATPVLRITQTSASTDAGDITKFFPDMATQVGLINDSTVPGKITGYNVVYRQLSTGQPIAVCGGAAGRRYQTLITLPALASNYSANINTKRYIMIVTDELMTHIATDLSTVSGGIDCEIIFYGEDDNGYDLQVEGVLHIDVL